MPNTRRMSAGRRYADELLTYSKGDCGNLQPLADGSIVSLAKLYAEMIIFTEAQGALV